jgi:hypothetical protein
MSVEKSPALFINQTILKNYVKVKQRDSGREICAANLTLYMKWSRSNSVSFSNSGANWDTPFVGSKGVMSDDIRSISLR